MLGHQRQVHHFIQRAVREFGNDSGREAIFRRGFNHQGELRRWLGQREGRLRRRILRSVDNVAPMNQVCERLGIEAELFPGDRGNELGARLVLRLVKHVRAGPAAKLFGVGGREKRALVMVEPPGYFRRIGKLEVDDDVFFAIEQPRFPGLRGAVRHPGEAELPRWVKSFSIKAVKESSGSSAVKTAIWKTEPDLGHRGAISPLLLQSV